MALLPLGCCGCPRYSPMIITREPFPLLCAVWALAALGESTTAVALTRTDAALLPLHRLVELRALLIMGCAVLLLLLLHTTGRAA